MIIYLILLQVIYVCCERLLELCGKGGSLWNLRNKPIEPTPPDLESLAGCSTSRDLSDSLENSLGLADSQDFLGSSSASFTNGEILNPHTNSSSNDGEDDDDRLENGDDGNGEEEGVNSSQDLAGMEYTRQDSSTVCEAKFTVQKLCEIIVETDKAKRSEVDALEVILVCCRKYYDEHSFVFSLFSLNKYSPRVFCDEYLF